MGLSQWNSAVAVNILKLFGDQRLNFGKLDYRGIGFSSYDSPVK